MPQAAQASPAFSPSALPAGMRSTRALRATLSLWGQQPAALLSQAQVLAALQAQGVRVNRVTVWRLLERLRSAGRLRRTVDTTRVARYALAADAQRTGAVQFECTDCHLAFALDDSAALRAALLQLHQALQGSGLSPRASVEVTVNDRCQDCRGQNP